MRSMKMSRTFNGKKYRYQGMHTTKTAASEHVDRIKRGGGKARKIKCASGWAIYAA